MVKIVESPFEDKTVNPEPYNTVLGIGKTIATGFSGDAVRALSGLAMGPKPTGDLQQEWVSNLLYRQNKHRLFGGDTIERPVDQILAVAREAGVPGGMYTNLLIDQSKFLEDFELRNAADFYAAKASERERIGGFASFVGELADPVMLGTLVAGAGAITRAGTTARLATQAGRATPRQAAMARSPFLFGAGAEGSLDLALQGIATGIDPSGERQIDLMGVALAAGIGGGLNKIMNGANPKLLNGFKPSAEQVELAKTFDELNKAGEFVERSEAVAIENGVLRNTLDTGEVSGGLIDARRMFAPLVKIYTSDVPAIRAVSRMIGGIQTQIGDKVYDIFGDIELEQMRTMNKAFMQIDPAIRGVQAVFREVGTLTDVETNRIMAAYIRRRADGIAAEDINLVEIFRGRVSENAYATAQEALEDLYVQHGKQMKQIADDMVASKVRGAGFLAEVDEGKYLTRAYNVITMPRIRDTIGIENVGKLFARAILNKQVDDIIRARAERLAKGEDKAKWYDAEKNLSPDEIIAVHRDDLVADADKFALQFGTGMAKRIIARMQSEDQLFSQVDAFELTDMADDAIRQILDGDAADIDDELVQLMRDLLNKSVKGKSRNDMGSLNFRVKLDETARLSFDELGLSAEQRMDIAKVLGRSRMSSEDSLSFEDFLFNDYSQLQQGYYHQFAAKKSLARRGIGQEGGASPNDLIALARKEVEDMRGKVSAKAMKRAEDDLAAFTYLMHTADGRGVDFARSSLGSSNPLMRANMRQHSAFSKIMGTFRNLSSSVHLGMVAFAQSSEAAQLIGSVGTRLQDVNRITGVLSDITKLHKSEPKSQLARDMAHMGFTHQGTMSRYDGTSFSAQMLVQEGDDAITRTYNASSTLREGMSWINLIKPITLGMRTLTVGRSYDKLYANAMGKADGFSKAELQTYLALNEEDMDDIYTAIREYAEVDKKTGAVKSLRVDLWGQLGPQYATAAAQIEGKLFNFAHKIVQESGRGYAPIFMQGGLGRTLFQFMSYASNSFEQQFVPTMLLAQRGDPGAASVRVSAAMLGSAVGYAGRLYVRSLGMSEERRKEYLQKNLTFQKMVLGTISYMPQLSGPMIAGGIANEILSGTLSGDPNAIRKGLPTAPAISVATDLAGLSALPRRLFDPEQEITESQLNKLANYAFPPFNTPGGILFRNAGSAALTGETPSFGALPAD